MGNGLSANSMLGAGSANLRLFRPGEQIDFSLGAFRPILTLRCGAYGFQKAYHHWDIPVRQSQLVATENLAAAPLQDFGNGLLKGDGRTKL